MDNNLTYKFMLNVNSLIQNNIFDDMACEACTMRFTLFKRKKQCRDCMRYFCADCVIKRCDRVLSCDCCSMLSRRPLVRSQVIKARAKDLKHYLIAKKISLRGCVEKEDLVSIVMQYANGPETPTNNERSHSAPPSPRPPCASAPPPSPPRRSRSPPTFTRPIIQHPEPDESQERSSVPTRSHEVEIEEISVSDTSPTISTNDPQPVITEQDVEDTSEEASNEIPSPMCTELPTWSGNPKLSQITECTDLEYLTVKQLKVLLSTNRVDFKGCVERSELLDRATRLWQASKKNDGVTTLDGPDDEGLCKICWDSPIECVILECGHLACCINCGKQMNECPICRQYVVRVVRFFKA